MRVPDGRGATRGERERVDGALRLATGEKCQTELARQLSCERGVGGKQVRRPFQQSDSGMHVVAFPSEHAGRSEARAGVGRELAEPPVVCAELGLEQIRAFEMEADELV